jgi:class I fructose-bisphosphate aldolase
LVVGRSYLGGIRGALDNHCSVAQWGKLHLTFPMIDNIVSLLGDRAEYLLKHTSQTIPTKLLHLPGPDWVDRIFVPSNRNQRVLNHLNWLYNSGRLAGTGYLSILPVDQGIEHSAGASFAKNPHYFDPENIVKLAEGGCNAVASTFGVLAAVSRKYAHKIPFLVKINHKRAAHLSEST